MPRCIHTGRKKTLTYHATVPLSLWKWFNATYFCGGVPLGCKKKYGRASIFPSTDYLSLLWTPFRIRWTIPLTITSAYSNGILEAVDRQLFGLSNFHVSYQLEDDSKCNNCQVGPNRAKLYHRYRTHLLRNISQNIWFILVMLLNQIIM